MILDILYGLVVWTRNRLYDLRVLPSYKGSLPTIVIGNLAIGGTGKTPHTEFIVRQLLAEGKHPAILSRGYKRKTKGFLLANAGSLTSDIGDEAMLLHFRLPDVPIAVCKDRLEGIEKIKELCPEVDIVVLDDAMQYRRLQADTTILLTRYNHLYPQDAYLPWGTLRDHKGESKRAQIIIVTGCPANISEAEKDLICGTLQPADNQEVLFSTISYGKPSLLTASVSNIPIDSDLRQNENRPQNKNRSQNKNRPQNEDHSKKITSSLRIGVFAGIANPQSFVEYVKTTYGKPDIIHLFSDHHWYSAKDIQFFENAIVSNTIDLWLTTEKDAVRLINNHHLIPTLQNKIAYIPIEIKII